MMRWRDQSDPRNLCSNASPAYGMQRLDTDQRWRKRSHPRLLQRQWLVYANASRTTGGVCDRVGLAYGQFVNAIQPTKL